MKKMESSQLVSRAKELLRKKITRCLGAAAIGLLGSVSASAGSFFSDFNSGLPTGTAVYYSATNDTSGGVSNSGCIKLTTAVNSVQGSFVITNDLDSGQPVVGFIAQFKAFVGGGTGADGFSFVFTPDLLNANGYFLEDGYGSGLTIAFDTYSNELDHIGIDVRWAGTEYYPSQFTGTRAGTWVDVLVQLTPDGFVQVMYDGNWIFTNNAPLGPTTITGGRFGFGARTGGANDNHWIDDVRITTFTEAHPYVAEYRPVGRNARADAPLHIVLTDYSTQVNPAKIKLQLDGTPVVPTITQATPNTTLSFQPPSIFAPGSAHTVSLSFADNSTPTSFTNNLQYEFTVAPYSILDTNLAAKPALVNTAASGFALRISQIDAHLGQTVSRAENQLANLLVDVSTGLPYPNLATVSSYAENGVVDYSQAGGQGEFPTDASGSIPGLPGSTGGTTNAALDAVTYLYLTPGFYQLGVNSSDGFRLTAASTPDLFAQQLATFNGVRAAATTTTTFGVAQAGYYPFRLVYFVGGTESVNPSANNPSLEFFSINASEAKTLINDKSTPGYLAAFRPAQTLPYIRSAVPAPSSSGVISGSPVDVTLVDGSITVQPGTIALSLNGAAVTPAISTAAGVTTIHYQPPSAFTPNSSNWVEVAFTDSAANRRTNGFYFTVENILTQLFQIAPGANPWVTAGSTERGIAYNPKTGHVLVARGSASTFPNPGGIAIFDGNNGQFIGQLSLALPDGKTINADGVGLFKLNLVDVAEDGVIYACALQTSWASNPFVIYRWQDETANPTIAASASQLGGSTRVGDDFRVRGSGAGTVILASGNSGVSTVPIFTTVDGTNFTGVALSVANLPSNSVRLGLAFGCNNTFYGTTTATPMQFITYNGPPSTVANRTATYTLIDSLGAQSIGAIGIDIANQRLIGNGTSQTTGNTHTMNLFDLPTLVTTGNNAPLDSKVFGTKNGNFGTGAIDFTPDGTRVYTLDTANGVIAFSLAPKLAPPNICGQPQNFFLPAVGTGTNVGFFAVDAIGAPLNYQWQFKGANILGATNRTLDLYNVQAANCGLYSVVVSNPLGSVTSAVAVLDVAMSIETQPTDLVVNSGNPASMTVGVTGGIPPYAFQWQLNGMNIPGATQATLNIPNAQAANGGFYTVVIKDVPGQTVTSATASLNVLITSTPGTGTGLTGDYYTNATYTTATPPDPFAGLPALSRVDPQVTFDWIASSPDGLLPIDYFAVRWHGQIQPLYSQTYTFYTRSDDGARLWVNGKVVIGDSWLAQAATERSGSIALVANQKYDIVLEYFEKTGNAVIDLSWFSGSQVKEIVPMTQLYPAAGPITSRVSAKLSGSNVVLDWVGTGTIYSAPDVTGPWTVLASGVVGPYSIPVGTAPRTFYRVGQQGN